jgi:hypothetical protein
MSEKTVVITESEGKYQIQNNGLSEFALIGILECILYEMKSTPRKFSFNKKNDIPEEHTQTFQETKEKVQEQVQLITPDLRIRIGNAVKAIKDLGGEIENIDLTNLSDEELQSELNELTNQYKRLKNSKGTKK